MVGYKLSLLIDLAGTQMSSARIMRVSNTSPPTQTGNVLQERVNHIFVSLPTQTSRSSPSFFLLSTLYYHGKLYLHILPYFLIELSQNQTDSCGIPMYFTREQVGCEPDESCCTARFEANPDASGIGVRFCFSQPPRHPLRSGLSRTGQLSR